MKFKVEIENKKTKFKYQSASFNSLADALTYIEREQRNDLLYGETDEYNYYLNGTRYN